MAPAGLTASVVLPPPTTKTFPSGNMTVEWKVRENDIDDT
jgi:hypothetical protein